MHMKLTYLLLIIKKKTATRDQVESGILFMKDDLPTFG